MNISRIPGIALTLAALVQAQGVLGPCERVNNVVFAEAASGHIEHAETAALASGDTVCVGVVLHNLASKMSLNGRTAEAERLAEKSVRLLEGTLPPNDPGLLRPLQLLSAVLLEQNKIANSREAFRKMLRIRVERPQERALVYGMGAELLHAENKLNEAETEYLMALGAWREAGGEASPEAGAALNALAAIYIEEHRFGEARQKVDRALAIFTAAKEAVPMDRTKALFVRAALYARQGSWREAEQDLREAIALAEGSPPDPVFMVRILDFDALALRKTHRGVEARSVRARADALRGHPEPNAIVDVTEFAYAARRKLR